MDVNQSRYTHGTVYCKCALSSQDTLLPPNSSYKCLLHVHTVSVYCSRNRPEGKITYLSTELVLPDYCDFSSVHTYMDLHGDRLLLQRLEQRKQNFDCRCVGDSGPLYEIVKPNSQQGYTHSLLVCTCTIYSTLHFTAPAIRTTLSER